MEAISYTVFINHLQHKWLYVPSLKLTLHDDWEVVRNEEMDIPNTNYTADPSRLSDPEYVKHMVNEMKRVEEEKKETNNSMTHITIRSELVDIMKELVKLYDEKVRLAFLEARVSKRVENIYPIEDSTYEEAMRYFTIA